MLSDHGFLLTMAPVVGAEGISPACHDVPHANRDNLTHIRSLLEADMHQLLLDEMADEPEERLAIFDRTQDAERAFRSAQHVYVHVEPQNGQVLEDQLLSVAVVGTDETLAQSLDRPSKGLNRLKDMAREYGKETVLYIQTLLSDDCEKNHATGILITHIAASHPDALLVVSCPLYFRH